MIRLMAVCVMALIVAGQASANEAKELNIYSSQKAHLIKPILDQFEQESGIKVNVTTLKGAAIIARMELEGKDTPADMVLAADIGNIYQLHTKGLLQPVTSDVLAANIPGHLRSAEGYWYGVAVRSRVIFHAKDRDVAFIPNTYDDLTDAKLKGKLLIRSSNNVYNQSLMASLIAHDGEEEAKAWAEGVVANMARPPSGGDRDQLRAVASGVGDVAVSNTYYYGQMLYGDDEKDKAIAESLQIVFPNQDNTGAHVNIRGAAVSKYSDNSGAAIKLVEFLSGEQGQHFFMTNNYEFPANPNVAMTAELKAFGEFKADILSLDKVGALNADAVRVFNEAGWK